MTKNYYKWNITLSIFICCILFLSCSKEIIKSSREVPNGYISAKYEDESFENTSIDICFPNPQYELVPGSDTAHIQTLIEFDKIFKKYFPQAIMMFSTITKVGWLFYEINYEADIPEYHTNPNSDLDYYLLLPDSLIKFQRESTADFLFVLYYSAFTANPPDSSIAKVKYSSIYDIEYAIWDRKNLALVTKDKVSSKVEFDRVVNKWPYRAAITKSAALICEKLPMFEK